MVLLLDERVTVGDAEERYFGCGCQKGRLCQRNEQCLESVLMHKLPDVQKSKITYYYIITLHFYI